MLCQAMTDMKARHADDLPVWREPVQARSRARVSAILDAVQALVAEAGHLDFKMGDVAHRAGVPIGSIYQYFPTRAVLLARLFAREMAPIDASLKAGLAQARSLEEVIAGIDGLIRSHIALVQQRAGLFVIWSSPTLDAALQMADLENSRKNADVIAHALLPLMPETTDPAAVWNTALLVCHLWGHVIRLCIMIEDSDPDQSVLEQYIGMITAHFRTLIA